MLTRRILNGVLFLLLRFDFRNERLYHHAGEVKKAKNRFTPLLAFVNSFNYSCNVLAI